MKKSYKIKRTQNIEDILNGLTIRFLSLRVEAPNREGTEWVVGLIDNEDDSELHYIRCNSHDDAMRIIGELVNRDCTRGIDIGENSTIVYLSCEGV